MKKFSVYAKAWILMLLFILAEYLQIPGFTNVVDALFVIVFVFIILMLLFVITVACATGKYNTVPAPERLPRWYTWMVEAVYLGFFAWSGWFVFVGVYVFAVVLGEIGEAILIKRGSACK